MIPAVFIIAGIVIGLVSLRGMPPIPKPLLRDFAPIGMTIAAILIGLGMGTIVNGGHP